MNNTGGGSLPVDDAVFNPARLAYQTSLMQANAVKSLMSDLARTRKMNDMIRNAYKDIDRNCQNPTVPTTTVLADYWCSGLNMTVGDYMVYSIAVKDV